MTFTGIIAAILGFGLLIIIHELGHFLAAKWMGVKVEKFSIGFPPKLFSKKIGETEFSISAIPLGGYVKMAGFIDESMDTKETGADYEYSSKPVWKRIVIITAGVIMNIILAIGLYTSLNYFQGENQNPSTTIQVVGTTGVAEKIGLKNEDKILAINGNEIIHWGQIYQSFVENFENGLDFKVLREGQEVHLNYKAEWFKEKDGEFLNIAPIYDSRVGQTISEMPAEEIGLERGDLIISLNDKDISNWDDMTKIIRENPGNKLSIEWLRNTEIMSSTLTPKSIIVQNEEGISTEIGQLGIYPFIIQKPVSFISAFLKGLSQPFEIIYLNIKGFKWILTGVKPVEDSLAGPITIVKMVGDAADRGWAYYISFLAHISSILAFFNILPIPALDGGHLAFLLIEGVLGKPLSVKTRLVVQQVGMAVLLSLIVFILYIDINRLF